MGSSIPDRLWTVEEIAAYLQVKPSVVRYWVQTESIPFIRLGRQVRFDTEEINIWIKQCKSGQSRRLARHPLERLE
jgi:excisionase family DNA binding protein